MYAAFSVHKKGRWVAVVSAVYTTGVTSCHFWALRTLLLSRNVVSVSVDSVTNLVGGESEVETPAGFIDVLRETEVIEVKYYRQWKHGLGQVLAYQSYYPLSGQASAPLCTCWGR